MKVFISWSGTRSRETALLLRNWLPMVINELDPWVSEEDIAAGGDWSGEITASLDRAQFGIICVTPGNMNRPWLLFEAGALSRQVSNEPSRVAPFLIGFNSKNELLRPLGRFQATLPQQADMLKLLSSMNQQCERPLQPEALKEALNVWWPRFEEKFMEIESSHPKSAPRRSDRSILDEILSTVRSLEGKATTASPPASSSLAAFPTVRDVRYQADLYNAFYRERTEAGSAQGRGVNEVRAMEQIVRAEVSLAGAVVESFDWVSDPALVRVVGHLPVEVRTDLERRYPFLHIVNLER